MLVSRNQNTYFLSDYLDRGPEETPEFPIAPRRLRLLPVVRLQSNAASRDLPYTHFIYLSMLVE